MNQAETQHAKFWALSTKIGDHLGCRSYRTLAHKRNDIGFLVRKFPPPISIHISNGRICRICPLDLLERHVAIISRSGVASRYCPMDVSVTGPAGFTHRADAYGPVGYRGSTQ